MPESPRRCRLSAPDPLSRRALLQGAASLLAGCGALSGAEPAPAPAGGEMPTRKLGRLDESVSLLAVGGWHAGRAGADAGARMIRQAIDGGVNLLDNAWEYHGGRAEEIMGRALADGYRDRALVLTKHHGRDAATAESHLADSLRRLRTDRIDLWMFHEVIYDEDPDRIFAPGGGLEAAVKAREAGHVRYLGFTGHKNPDVFLDMLGRGFEWDAVMLPLNPLDATYESFETRVLPELVRQGIAPLAMKTRGAGAILDGGVATLTECWRYAIGLPIAGVVSGMLNERQLQEGLEMARTLTPMSELEREVIRARAREAALTGLHEPYKSTTHFDSPHGKRLRGG